MLDGYFRQRGIRDRVEIEYFTRDTEPAGEAHDPVVWMDAESKRRNIKQNYEFVVRSIDPEKKVVQGSLQLQLVLRLARHGATASACAGAYSTAASPILRPAFELITTRCRRNGTTFTLSAIAPTCRHQRLVALRTKRRMYSPITSSPRSPERVDPLISGSIPYDCSPAARVAPLQTEQPIPPVGRLSESLSRAPGDPHGSSIGQRLASRSGGCGDTFDLVGPELEVLDSAQTDRQRSLNAKKQKVHSKVYIIYLIRRSVYRLILPTGWAPSFDSSSVILNVT